MHGHRAGATTRVLRIDFPGGAATDQLEHVSWDEWFTAFDDAGPAMTYQAKKRDGDNSTFFRLVRP